MRNHLQRAHRKRYISLDELGEHAERYTEIEKMLSGLITHLNREDRKHRVPTLTID